jgi:hypothetical protein
VQHRPGRRGFEREAEQARGVVAVDRRPAVVAVADVATAPFSRAKPIAVGMNPLSPLP